MGRFPSLGSRKLGDSAQEPNLPTREGHLTRDRSKMTSANSLWSALPAPVSYIGDIPMSSTHDDPYILHDDTIQPPPSSLWKALAKIGPGIILAGSIIGTGELLLTTGLGAEWGFAFLWLILFSCAVKVFVQ